MVSKVHQYFTIGGAVVGVGYIFIGGLVVVLWFLGDMNIGQRDWTIDKKERHRDPGGKGIWGRGWEKLVKLKVGIWKFW